MGIYEKIDGKDLPGMTILRYQKIYNIIFKYCFFIIIIIVDIILFIVLSKNTIALNWVDKYPNERENLLASMNKEKNNTTNTDITGKIIQGNLGIDENGNIFSVNNLITYKGFVMPRYFKVSSINKILPKSNFVSGYDITDLEYFINNIIFSDYKTNDEASQAPLLPLTDDSISNTFFVSCLESNPNGLCKQFITNFVNTFYVYNIATDYPGLNKVFNEIKGTEFKSNFCEGIMKYISYTHDTSADIEGIMSQCGDEMYNEFLSIKSFFGIQQQLDNGYIKSTLSTDPDVNAYKLLSYQQLLYNNVMGGMINEANFTTYLNFISSLLKKDGSIENIYLDITYWIDNVYLIPTLNTKKYKLTESKRNELDGIINDIYAMNYGNKLEGHYGLESKIINNDLTALGEESIANSISGHEQDEMSQLLKSIKSLSYLKVTNDKIVGSFINIEGYLTIKGLDDPLAININFENKNGKPIVKKVLLANYENLNDTLNTLLEKEDNTIVDVYEYLSKSVKLFESNDFATPCELIKSKLDGIGNVISCKPDNIAIKREDGTTFRFVMSNYDIQKVIISDKDLETVINNLTKNIYTNDATIASIVFNILTYRDTKGETKQEASLTVVTALQTISQYLGTEITDIEEKGNGTIYTEFTLGDILFDAMFDPETNTLTALKFHEKGITIRRFSLVLNNDYANDINNFKTDPLNYLEQFDKTAVNLYKTEEQ